MSDSLLLEDSFSPGPQYVEASTPLAESNPETNEIPYYDEELDVAQSDSHRYAIGYFLPLFQYIAEKTGLEARSDNPTSYPKIIENNKTRYADVVLTRKKESGAYEAADLHLVAEVVTIENKAKMEKDTVTQKKLNQQHEVPEFVLIWPELKDTRTINWFRLNEKTRRYREMKPDKDGWYHASSVPGLAMRVLPVDQWREGRKVIGAFRGQIIEDLSAQIKKTEEVMALAHAERSAREQAEGRAEQAEGRAEQAEGRADAERRAREQAESELLMLRQRLRELGIEP